MDLVVIVLAAMSGALIGSSTGIFLMYRKLRPINAADLDALRSKVRTTEFDLNAAIANGVKLKKEVAEHASKANQDVLEKQRQLDAVLAAKNLESAHRNAAEQRIAELIAEADARQARDAEVEAKVKELQAKAAELEARGAQDPGPAAEEQQRQVAAFQAQVETGGRQIRELTEQLASLAAEAAELKQRSEEAEKARAALEVDIRKRSEEAEKARAELEVDFRKRSEEADKARTAIEAESRQRSEEADKARSALEADLASERERLRSLTEQVSEMRSELSAQDVRMQEERESAARGMELLVMAQQNLSRVIQAAEAPVANGGNGHRAPAPAEVKGLLAGAAQ